MKTFWLYLGIILACSGIGTVAGIILIVLYIWGDIREAIDKTNPADNSVKEENYNANEYSKDTAEEMR
jgi:hypothetical protein